MCPLASLQSRRKQEGLFNEGGMSSIQDAPDNHHTHPKKKKNGREE